jgi:beta-fructofuranosidase
MTLRLADRWIWDSWYVQHDGLTHAFYLCASRTLGDPERRHLNTIVGHAVSHDLVSWRELDDALVVSDPGAFDDRTTWTGSVVRADDGEWWMFYTGTSICDLNLVQRVGIATSPDLATWTKRSTQPVVVADPALYLTDDVDEAWRDPWVFRRGSSWHMLVTARASVDSSERGVVGHATSTDLVEWSVQPPLSAPGQGFDQMEVLQFEEVDGVPVLLFSCGIAELGADRRAAGETGGVYSLAVDPLVSEVDFTRAQWFPRHDLYAARLVRGEDGGWMLLAFVDTVQGEFVGELCDPVPVIADPLVGLVPR